MLSSGIRGLAFAFCFYFPLFYFIFTFYKIYCFVLCLWPCEGEREKIKKIKFLEKGTVVNKCTVSLTSVLGRIQSNERSVSVFLQSCTGKFENWDLFGPLLKWSHHKNHQVLIQAIILQLIIPISLLHRHFNVIFRLTFSIMVFLYLD